jgi:hypothetical protein
VADFVALFDACVFYPAQLRDILLRVALSDTFKARWTDQIHGEWIGSLLRDRPDIPAERLTHTRELMNRAVPDCLVTGYEPFIQELTLPDPDDRHVLAAAIRCQAGVIVTLNVRDFPDEVVARYGISVQHPDEFLGLRRSVWMTLRSGRCSGRPERAVRHPEATEGQVDDDAELGEGAEAVGAADLRLDGRVDRLGALAFEWAPASIRSMPAR